jgi:type I restriction enzyme R subunit
MLYADAKAIGVVEAKPEDFTLTGVETQSGKYADGLPHNLPAYRLPLPFAYPSLQSSFSTGSESRTRTPLLDAC